MPENVTNAPKTPIAASREPLVEDKLIVAKRGENFEQVMRAAGAAPDQIRAMIQAFAGKVRVAALPDGQVLQVLYAPGPRPGDPRQIVRVSFLTDGQPDGTVAINDAGAFVSGHPARAGRRRAAAAARARRSDRGRGDRGRGRHRRGAAL